MSIGESLQNMLFGKKVMPTASQVQSAYSDAGIDYTKLRNIAEGQLDPESQYMQDKLSRLENVSQDEIATNQMLTERMYDKFGGNANPAVLAKQLADFQNTRADKTRVQGQQIIDQSEQSGMRNLSQIMSNEAQIVKQGIDADIASKQEDAQRRRDLLGFAGSVGSMFGFGMQEGGLISQSLKQIPAGNKGLAKLPEEVRNRMGYMQYGGMVPKYAYGGMVKKKGYQAGDMVTMTPEEYLKTNPPNAIAEMIKSGMKAGDEFIGPMPKMTPEEEMWQRAVTGDPNKALKLPSKEAVEFLSEVKKPEEKASQAPTVNPNAKKILEQAMSSGEISLPGPSLLNRIFEKAGAGAGTLYGGLSGAVQNPKTGKAVKGILDFLTTSATEIARPGTYQTNKLLKDLDLKPVEGMQEGGEIKSYLMDEQGDGKNFVQSLDYSKGFEDGDEMYDYQDSTSSRKGKEYQIIKDKDGRLIKYPTTHYGGLLSGVRNLAGQLMGPKEINELPEEIISAKKDGMMGGGYVKYPMRIGGYKID